MGPNEINYVAILSMTTKEGLDKLTYQIIGAAIEVHKILGAGLNESIYHKFLILEFHKRGIQIESEKPIYIEAYERQNKIDFKADFIVENSIIVEIKSVEYFTQLHEAQILNYMKLLKLPKGILINFRCANIFYSGQKTFVNEHYALLPQSEYNKHHKL